LTPQIGSHVIPALLLKGLEMDARFVFSALAGLFCLVLIGAAITSYRHISNRPTTTISQTR
jgi:hypothetical protein